MRDVNTRFTKIYGPETNLTRAVTLIVIANPVDTPIVVDGQIKISKMMNIQLTFDARCLDGSLDLKMVKPFLDVFNNPHKYF